MPMNYALPVISKSGHVYDITIQLVPHDKERTIDPCGRHCWKECMEEMNEIASKIKVALNPNKEQQK